MNDFSYCAISRIIIFSTVLLLSCSGKTEVVNYLGCEWVIPNDYNKISEYEYFRAGEELSGSIIFGEENQEYYSGLSEDPDIIHLEFVINDVGGLTVSSHFIVNENIGIGISHISIMLKSRDISLYGLERNEALTLSQFCIDPEVMIEHYNKLDSWYNEYCGEFGSGKTFCGDR